jgi:hypothetical protein
MFRDSDDNVLKAKLSRAMTVGDLLDYLSDLDRDLPVGFACDYGDYTHTTQFLLVEEARTLADDASYLGTTAYSQSGLCVREPDEEDDEEYDAAMKRAESFPAVVLR